MKGAFTSLLGQLPEVQHNDKGESEKVLRYAVCRERKQFLERNGVPFGSSTRPTGEQIHAFIVELEAGEADPRMPQGTTVEYFACSILPSGERITIAYLWFSSVAEAIAYGERHGLSILKGFRGS